MTTTRPHPVTRLPRLTRHPTRLTRRLPRLTLRLPRLTLRSQLTLLYAGFLCAAGIAILAVPIFTIRQSMPVVVTPAIMHQIQGGVRAQQVRATVTFLALVAVSLPIGWLIAGRFLRPLRRITATAQDISASNLSQRLDPAPRDDEFADLGATLNGLFARLEQSFEAQRQFVANASHELRTPLSASRALLQVAATDPDATVESLQATCDEVLALGQQQEQLIAALLALAKSQHGVERWRAMDLAEITGHVLADRQDQARRRGIRVSAELASALASGDPRLAESLVANLVDNAIRHNVPGGEVEIRVRNGPTGAAPAQAGAAPTRTGAVLSVINSGPVISPDQVDRLFQPFRQIGNERLRQGQGYGLGLAITDAIARAHGATLTARVRPQGGLEVEVSFPSARVTLPQRRDDLLAEQAQRRARFRVTQRAEGEGSGEVIAAGRPQHLAELGPHSSR
jgi:signal transduction histidine kinase